MSTVSVVQAELGMALLQLSSDDQPGGVPQRPDEILDPVPHIDVLRQLKEPVPASKLRG